MVVVVEGGFILQSEKLTIRVQGNVRWYGRDSLTQELYTLSSIYLHRRIYFMTEHKSVHITLISWSINVNTLHIRKVFRFKIILEGYGHTVHQTKQSQCTGYFIVS